MKTLNNLLKGVLPVTVFMLVLLAAYSAFGAEGAPAVPGAAGEHAAAALPAAAGAAACGAASTTAWWVWPLVLFVLGGLFLLDNLKIVQVNIWGIFIPVVLILGGISVLVGSISHARRGETTSLSIPLEGSETAMLHIKYGAGRLAFSGGAASGELLSGTFEGGVDHHARR